MPNPLAASGMSLNGAAKVTGGSEMLRRAFKNCESCIDMSRAVLQGSQERRKVFLLINVQFQLKDKIEKFHRVFKRRQPPIVEVGRRILDAAQGEGLSPYFGSARIEGFDL